MEIQTSNIELHAHPYFDKYSLEEVLKAMDETNLDIIGLEYLNRPIFDELNRYADGLKQKGYKKESDNYVIKLSKDEKNYFILRAKEIRTKDNFDIITIGSDTVNSEQNTRKVIDDALEQGVLIIFDHPFVDNSWVNKEINEYKRKELEKICKEYSGKLALELNGYCKPWLRKVLGGKDVNKMVIELSKRLYNEGYNLPLLADSDIHARSKSSLKALGTGRIRANTYVRSGNTLIDSMKKSIFSLGEGKGYENVYDTVSFPHFVFNFGIPYLNQKISEKYPSFKKFFYRPRG